jgi:hypothetical protein
MGKRYHVRKISKPQHADADAQPPSKGDLVSYVSSTDGKRVMGHFISFKKTQQGKVLASLRRVSDSKIVSVDPVKKSFRVEIKPAYASFNTQVKAPSPW